MVVTVKDAKARGPAVKRYDQVPKRCEVIGMMCEVDVGLFRRYV